MEERTMELGGRGRRGVGDEAVGVAGELAQCRSAPG